MAGKEFVHFKYVDLIQHDNIFVTTIPIIYEDEIVGILFATYPVDSFFESLNKKNYSSTLTTNIITLEGEILAENYNFNINQAEFLEKINLDKNIKYGDKINLYSQNIDKNHSIALIKIGNEEYYVGYSSIENSNDIFVLVSVPKKIVLSNSNKILFASIILLIIIISIVLIYFINLTMFNKKYFELKKANSAKKVFLANISHEMRTPISGIIGLISIVEKINKDEKISFYLNKMDVISNHLLGLINDVLDISKIEANQIEINNVKLNIEDLVNNINIIIKDKIEKKKQKYRVNIEGLENLELFADKIKIKQILINLLTNSIKFTHENGSINLAIKLIDKDEINNKVKIKFEVSDNGIGISEEFKSKLFDPFAQEDNLYSRKFEGSGLGLFICKRLLTAMNSELIVDSKLNRGSIFEFSLWLSIYEESKEKSKLLIDVKELKGKNVLFVEDNEINRIIGKEKLKGLGFNVDLAKNGQEGIDKFINSEINYYSYILMDIQMPIMDGYEATRRIRKSNREDSKSVKIIAVTANSFVDSENEVLNSGMNAHLIKPVSEENLLETLANL